MSYYSDINNIFNSMIDDISYIKIAHFTRTISKTKDQVI